MAKSKTYEMLLKIAGKTDGSLKAACSAAEKDLNTLGDAAKKVGKVAATALAGIATAAAGVAASSLSAYSEFEQAMDSTAVTARATEEEYELMEAAARQMGATTTKTATEAAEAMGYMALAGWDVEQSMAGLEPMLRLSEATGMDLARASDLATDSMSALGLGVEDMTDYLDLAVQAQRASNTTAEALMEAFIGCGGAAKTAGVDMGDLSTALGILANNGTKGAEAGTAMNAMINRLTSKDVAIKAMQQMGVSVYDAAGEFRGLETILTDVSSAMADMTTQEKMGYLAKIAGTNYATEMSYLLAATSKDAAAAEEFLRAAGLEGDELAEALANTSSAWSTLETDIMDHSGVLLEVAQANTENLAGATAIFQSAVAELQLQIGEQLAPYAKEGLEYLANNVLPSVAEKLGEIIPKVIETGKAFLEHKDVILAIAAGIGTAVTAYKAAKIGMAAYGAAMSIYQIVTAASATGTFTLAGAMTALNIPMLATVAAIGAVVAIAILLVKNWDKVKAAAIAAWEKIKAVWNSAAAWFNDNVVNPVVNFFTGLWESIKGIWNTVATWFNQNVITPLVNFFAPIVSFVSGFFRGCWILIQAVWVLASTWFKDHVITPVVAAFSVVVGAVSGFFTTLWGNIVTVWTTVSGWFTTNVINPIINTFSTIVAAVGGFFTTLWGNIVAVWTAAGAWFSENVAAPINAAFQAVSDFVKGIFNGLLGFVENMINGIIGAINKFVGGFSGVVEKAAGFIGVEWSGINEIPQVTLPRLATGGIVTAPTILEAGEGGEAEAILPLSKLAAMLQSVANAPEIPDLGNREDGPEEAPLAQLAKMLDDWTRNNKPDPHGPGRGGGGAWGPPEPQRPGANENPPPAGGQNPPGGGGVDTITFAPVFNFYGTTTPEQAKEAGQISFTEFKRLYNQMKAEERRKNLRASTH